MIDFKHLQGNLVTSVTGVSLGFLGKKLLHKEFIPANSMKDAAISFGFLMTITILGKITMDKMSSWNVISFDTKGFPKNPNEGFIGPLKNETFGPPNWA